MSYRRGDKVRVNAIYVDGNDGDEIDMYINRFGTNQAGQETYRLQKDPFKGGQENGGVSWGGFTEDDFIKADDPHEKAVEHLQSIKGSVSYRNYIEKRLAADYAILISDHIKKLEWISAETNPPPHINLWCLNRCGRQFQGRVCFGMHRPLYTLCYGEKDGSDTCPTWIDVTHYMILPDGPKS